MSPRTSDGSRIVSGNSSDWQETRELLGASESEVGVLALEEGTEVLNGTRESLISGELRMDEIDAVRGNYLVFPEEMVAGVRNQVGKKSLGPEDVNDANFYVGHSNGVPWFEVKLVEDYTIPGREEPHVHDAWEFYSFEGGNGVLDVAGENYDFGMTDPGTWDYRHDVMQLNANDGEVVAVPPGVPHKVNQQYGNPDLVVARYSEEGHISRYSLEGEKQDRWSTSGQDFEMQAYTEALE